MSTPTDYGEPWAFQDTMEENVIIDAKGECPIKGDFYVADDRQMKRAISCVNALAGISEPEAALQAAREALEAAETQLQLDTQFFHGQKYKNQPACDAIDAAIFKVRATLELLTPAKP